MNGVSSWPFHYLDIVRFEQLPYRNIFRGRDILKGVMHGFASAPTYAAINEVRTHARYKKSDDECMNDTAGVYRLASLCQGPRGNKEGRHQLPCGRQSGRVALCED